MDFRGHKDIKVTKRKKEGLLRSKKEKENILEDKKEEFFINYRSVRMVKRWRWEYPTVT